MCSFFSVCRFSSEFCWRKQNHNSTFWSIHQLIHSSIRCIEQIEHIKVNKHISVSSISIEISTEMLLLLLRFERSKQYFTCHHWKSREKKKWIQFVYICDKGTTIASPGEKKKLERHSVLVWKIKMLTLSIFHMIYLKCWRKRLWQQ